MQIIPYLIATLIPVVVLFIIYKLDIFKVGAFRFVLLSFLWGVVAFTIAYWLNTTLLSLGWITNDQLVRYEAPIAEEILKALILYYLIRRPEFTYFVDGAIYGFAIGIGFAVVENYYFLSISNAPLALSIVRVISTNLMHATCSAIVGISFALLRFERGSRRVGIALSGLLAAIAIHMAYNNVVDRVSGILQLAFAIALGIGGAIVIAFIMKVGLAHEKTWIEEKLGMADRVSAQEARVVQRLTEMSQVLAPVTERFGKAKSAQIEKFLTTQAQLGIKRKTLDKLTDEKMRQAVEKEMAELRKQMDQARRDVGSYAMLYVRTVLPDESNPVWNILNTKLQKLAVERPAGGGINYQSILDQKINKINPKPPDQAPGS